MKKIFATLIITLLFSASTLIAQSEDCTELTPVSGGALDDIGSLLGDATNKIEKACIITEDDGSISINISFTGFSDKDYVVHANIQGTTKKALKEFEKQAVPASGGSVDVQFEFKREKAHAGRLEIESKFLQVIITTPDDALVESGITLNGISKTFKLERKWKVQGGASGADGGKNMNENIVVTAKLTPFQSAETIIK